MFNCHTAAYNIDFHVSDYFFDIVSMAKSIRSKWRRKMRAVKRERYGKKELERLKKTVAVTTDAAASASTTEMIDVSDVAKVVTKEEILAKKQKVEETNDEVEMEVEVGKRRFNSKTLRDQNGTYPIWVHPRKIRKHKKEKKKNKTRSSNKKR